VNRDGRSGAGPHPSVAPAALDERALESLREIERQGAAGLFAKALGLYLRTAPALLDSVRAAAAAGDCAALARAAHTLTSSSRYVGAAQVAETAGKIELAARADPPVIAEALVADLAAAYARTEALLRAEISRAAA
jgi:HPt (histidine-containing phosphotransfer) domain-containing protein